MLKLKSIPVSGLIGVDTLKLLAPCLLMQIIGWVTFRGAASIAALWVVGAFLHCTTTHFLLSTPFSTYVPLHPPTKSKDAFSWTHLVDQDSEGWSKRTSRLQLGLLVLFIYIFLQHICQAKTKSFN